MGEWPRKQLVSELVALAKLGHTVLKGSKPEPLDHLIDKAPSLADIVPPVLLPPDPKPADLVEAAKELLGRVAFATESDEVRAAGDLLGFTDLSNEEMRAVFKCHKEKKPSSDLKSFSRYHRETRKILAVRHEGRTIQWLSKTKEEAWFTLFVDEFCTYLDDEDGKLTEIARSLIITPKVREVSKEVELSSILQKPNQTTFQLMVGGKVNRNEAIALVLKELPHADLEEVQLLVDSLCLHSNLVVRAVYFLTRNEDVSPGDLARSIVRDAALAIDMLQVNSELTLAESFRQFIGRLAERHADSLSLLWLLTFGANSFVSYELAGSYLLEQQTITNDESVHASFALRRALTPLVDFGLVTSGEATIQIDCLAQDVLYAILEEHLDDFVQRARVIECSRQDILDAGWGPVAVAGRETFYAVVNSRYVDYMNDGTRRKRGELGGPGWAKSIVSLWLSIYMRELGLWIPGRFMGKSCQDLKREDLWKVDPGLGMLQRADAKFSRESYAMFSEAALKRRSYDSSAAEPTDSSFDAYAISLAKVQVGVEKERLAVLGAPVGDEEKWANDEIDRIVQKMEVLRDIMRFSDLSG